MSRQSIDASALTRFFSSSVLKELALYGKSPAFMRSAIDSCIVSELEPTDPISNLFDLAFSHLKKHQNRNEYIYKSAITQKILLGRHSLNTATMLSEFRIGLCKADMVILNGAGTVYEIKSERDSLTRLEQQLKEYRSVFSKVNVIAAASHLERVKNIAPEDVGIQVLTNRHTIKTIRDSQNQPERTCPVKVLESVTSKEAELILKDIGETPPNVPNTQRYKVHREIFSKQEPTEIQISAINILKKTRSNLKLKSIVAETPASLHNAILSVKLRNQDYSRLLNALKTPLEEASKWS